jgi:hypothetical protein
MEFGPLACAANRARSGRTRTDVPFLEYVAAVVRDDRGPMLDSSAIRGSKKSARGSSGDPRVIG